MKDVNGKIIKNITTSSRFVLCINEKSKQPIWLSESQFRNQFMNVDFYNRNDIYWAVIDNYTDNVGDFDESQKLNHSLNFDYGDILVAESFYIYLHEPTRTNRIIGCDEFHECCKTNGIQNIKILNNKL